MRPLPGRSAQAIAIPVAHPAHPAHSSSLAAMAAAVATISNRMRLNFFAHRDTPEPSQPSAPPPQAPPPGAGPVPPAPARPAKTYPADMIVWGIVIRPGFDELDDPWYHRGVTQHAYVEGSDEAALCGFRPPLTGSRGRRRPRLGLPSAADHPMCGMCARMVVTPRPRVPVPVQPFRPAVAVPVAPGVAVPRPVPVSVAPRSATTPAMPAQAAPAAPGAPAARSAASAQPPAGATTSPWVRRYAGGNEPAAPAASVPVSHDSGLLARGVHLDGTPD
jgi:hypothetical protein